MTSKYGGLWCKFPDVKIPALVFFVFLFAFIVFLVRIHCILCLLKLLSHAQSDIVALVQKMMATNCVDQVCGGYPFEHHGAIIYMPSIDEEDED
jgi:hypothetical protein